MWKDDVFRALQNEHMFEDSAHQSRFKELIDCYYSEPFFTPGLCKCMYLSCWDDEHFFIMLDMMNQLKFGNDMGLDDMNENGQLMAEEETEHDYDPYILQLSCAFIQDEPFFLNEVPEDIEPQGHYLIRQALKAAEIIDEYPFS